jgi:hypothetical protein
LACDGAAAMQKNYVLIDYENVPIKSLALLTGEQFHVRVFLGPKNIKLPLELVLTMHTLKHRAEYVVLETVGNNALDFHIAYYLGTLAATEPNAVFHVISKDTGFDPLLAHLKKQKMNAVRSVSLETMPCFQQLTETPVPVLSIETPALGAIKTAIKVTSGSNKIKPAPQLSVDDLFEIALNDLMRRKQGRPAKPATLLNTIHSVCGKKLPKLQIEQVYTELIKRGYVTERAGKIEYSLNK